MNITPVGTAIHHDFFSVEGRTALKREHPGLSDETIDRAEELLAQRFLVDPEAEPQRVQELDRQRAESLAREMPRFKEVLQKVAAEEANEH